jgi:hypothetical protein
MLRNSDAMQNDELIVLRSFLCRRLFSCFWSSSFSLATRVVVVVVVVAVVVVVV